MKRVFTILFIYLSTVLAVAVLLSGCASSKKTHTSTVEQMQNTKIENEDKHIGTNNVYHKESDTNVKRPASVAENELSEDSLNPLTTASGVLVDNVITTKVGDATLTTTVLPNGKVRNKCTCDSLNIVIKKLDSTLIILKDSVRKNNFERTVAQTTSKEVTTEKHSCKWWLWLGIGMVAGMIIILTLQAVWLMNKHH